MLKSTHTKRTSPIARIAVLCSLALAGLTSPAHARGGGGNSTFDMVRSPALNAVPDCVADASGTVTIVPGGPVEVMTVRVTGLPPNTDFDFFVIQQPNGPFGVSWYQGDIETNGNGVGSGKFIGRFSIETFVVAPGSVPAPVTFDNAFPSASLNPPTAPIQMYHLGLWFNSPTDAGNAGCPASVTPFNGEHNAGIQVLNTSNFPDLQGPLINVQSSQ